MDTSQKNEKNTKYFWAAIAVLTLLSAGLGYLYLQEKKINDQKQVKIDQQIKEQVLAGSKLDSMSRELNLKIQEVQNLGGDIGSLQQIKSDLEADKKLLMNQKSLNIKSFEAKIKNYEMLLAQKDVEIVKLREENGMLTSQNQTLNSENTGLKSDKIKLADSINTVSAKNKELSEKVTLASALRAETINVYAVSSRGKEREGGSYNARRVDKIRISFHLVDNPLTKQEEKEIIIRLLDPSGTIISDMATGSGIFTYNGQETIYTAKKREQYTNSHQLVEFLYSRGQEYKQGKYSIELYCEGYKIGQGSFDVK
ncbi:MAG: hypothetical protein V4683_01020 [Bacteroidota bacterium]